MVFNKFTEFFDFRKQRFSDRIDNISLYRSAKTFPVSFNIVVLDVLNFLHGVFGLVGRAINFHQSFYAVNAQIFPHRAKEVYTCLILLNLVIHLKQSF